jgi:hypothetical protein
MRAGFSRGRGLGTGDGLLRAILRRVPLRPSLELSERDDEAPTNADHPELAEHVALERVTRDPERRCGGLVDGECDPDAHAVALVARGVVEEPGSASEEEGGGSLRRLSGE